MELEWKKKLTEWNTEKLSSIPFHTMPPCLGEQIAVIYEQNILISRLRKAAIIGLVLKISKLFFKKKSNPRLCFATIAKAQSY